MKTKIILFLILSQLISCKTQNVKKDSISDYQKIDNFIQYNYQNNLFNGSVLVVKNDSVIYKKTLGFENPTTKKALDKNSKFYIASVSKPFTALAILQLEEKGLLKLDNKLSTYFSEFPKYAEDVTITNLLNHTSGIVNHYDIGMQKKGMTNQNVLDEIIKHELQFNPGEKFSYSNSGYILLAMLIERVTKQSFSNYMQENIFKPLKMNNTLVGTKENMPIKNRVQGTTKYGDTKNNIFYNTGSTGIYTTAEDLYLFEKGLYNTNIIQKKSLEKAYQFTHLLSGKKSDYGLGWHVIENKDKSITKAFHTGGGFGFNSFFFRDIKNKHTVIVMSTNRGAFNLFATADALTHVLYDKEVIHQKIPMSIVLHHSIDENSEIQKKFNELKKNENLIVNEDDFNEYGYYLIGKKRLKQANRILKINTELYPKSSNVWDSYAESFLELGEIEKAKKFYLKSFELNPKIKNPEKELQNLIDEFAKNHN